jgi:hypothetical protein
MPNYQPPAEFVAEAERLVALALAAEDGPIDLTDLHREPIVLAAEDFDALVAALDAPLDPAQADSLRALLNRPSRFTQEAR